MKPPAVLYFFAAMTALPGAAIAEAKPVEAEKQIDYKAMFAIASDCSVALSMLDDQGRQIDSSPDDWANVMVNLGDKLGRDAYLEYLFRETEVSALMEVEPAETAAWMNDTAEQCSALLPAETKNAAVPRDDAGGNSG